MFMLTITWTFFSFLDDYNRVILKTIPEVEHSDYINASYIDVSKVTCHTIQCHHCPCRVTGERVSILDHKVNIDLSL